MSRHVTSALVAMSVALAACSAQAAPQRPSPQERPTRHHQTTASITPHAIGGAASNARLAAIIDAGGSVVRSKGVQSVTHPYVGAYCIRPSSTSGVNAGNIVPSVSVDYDGSAFNEAMAQYSDAGADCPLGTIEVLTFGDGDHNAVYADSDGVGFTIVVP